MIVKTDKGYILVDKDGNKTPLTEEEKKSEKTVDNPKKK
jgi:hypothetical protein